MTMHILRRLLVGLAASMVLAAHAQPALESEGQRVRVEREQAEAAFGAERAACYKKFAVNQCLDDVRRRRGDVMSDLKRQQTLLNDEQRRRDAAEQVRSLEARRAATLASESPERQAALEADQRAREQRQQNKAADRDSTAQRARVREERQVVRAAPVPRDPQAMAAADARATAGASEREREMQQRKSKRQAEIESRRKPVAQPLPVPQ